MSVPTWYHPFNDTKGDMEPEDCHHWQKALGSQSFGGQAATCTLNNLIYYVNEKTTFTTKTS